MSKINSKLIEKACHDLCVEANTNYDENLYKIVENKYAAEKNDSTKNKLANIIKNAQIAYENKRPLCQDTGQVIVFVYIGQQVQIEGDNINKAINKGIKKAYKKNYYRQSVVKDALFNRNNTNTNTPAIIYTEFTDTDYIEIKMMIKGAGSENYSAMQMLKPTSTKEEIFNFIKNCLEQAGEKSCPPYVLGIGVGGTAEKALLLSKEAFFEKEQNTQQKEFINELNQHLQGLTNNILDIKLKTAPTHIACLPIGITINCHSCRHSVCKITQNEMIIDKNNNKFKTIEDKNINLKEIHTNDIEEIRKLKSGEEILLTGEVYTARDAAHEKLKKYFIETGTIPINLKNKIIFYAGPCPPNENEIIGPIGPTTSTRMDKYCEFMYENGVIATIGKGERSPIAISETKRYNAKYLTAQGGIACVLASCIKNAETIAYEELGTEAIRKLTIEKLPLKVEI